MLHADDPGSRGSPLLACARLGQQALVYSAGFAAHETGGAYFDDAQQDVILTAFLRNRGRPYYPYKHWWTAAIKKRPTGQALRGLFSARNVKAGACIVIADLECSARSPMPEPADAVPYWPADPLYILYTSWHYRQPRALMRDHRRHAGRHCASGLQVVYDCGPGDVFRAALMVGWVGRPLLHLFTGLLARRLHHRAYEGNHSPHRFAVPSAGLCRVRRQALFAAPTAFGRAIRKEDPTRSLGAFARRTCPNWSGFTWQAKRLDRPPGPG